MFRFLADENFDKRVLDGVSQRADIDLVRAQEVGLGRASDATVLSWAVASNRIVLTHDVSTMSPFAWERIALSEFVPGVWEVPNSMAVGRAIDEIVLMVMCSQRPNGQTAWYIYP